MEACWRLKRLTIIWLAVSIATALLAGASAYYTMVLGSMAALFVALVLLSVFIVSLILVLMYRNKYKLCVSKHSVRRTLRRGI